MARKKNNPHLFTTETARACKRIAAENRQKRLSHMEQHPDLYRDEEQPAQRTYALRARSNDVTTDDYSDDNSNNEQQQKSSTSHDAGTATSGTSSSSSSAQSSDQLAYTMQNAITGGKTVQCSPAQFKLLQSKGAIRGDGSNIAPIKKYMPIGGVGGGGSNSHAISSTNMGGIVHFSTGNMNEYQQQQLQQQQLQQQYQYGIPPPPMDPEFQQQCFLAAALQQQQQQQQQQQMSLDQATINYYQQLQQQQSQQQQQQQQFNAAHSVGDQGMATVAPMIPSIPFSASSGGMSTKSDSSSSSALNAAAAAAAAAAATSTMLSSFDSSHSLLQNFSMAAAPTSNGSLMHPDLRIMQFQQQYQQAQLQQQQQQQQAQPNPDLIIQSMQLQQLIQLQLQQLANIQQQQQLQSASFSTQVQSQNSQLAQQTPFTTAMSNSVVGSTGGSAHMGNTTQMSPHSNNTMYNPAAIHASTTLNANTLNANPLNPCGTNNTNTTTPTNPSIVNFPSTSASFLAPTPPSLVSPLGGGNNSIHSGTLHMPHAMTASSLTATGTAGSASTSLSRSLLPKSSGIVSSGSPVGGAAQNSLSPAAAATALGTLPTSSVGQVAVLTSKSQFSSNNSPALARSFQQQQQQQFGLAPSTTSATSSSLLGNNSLASFHPATLYPTMPNLRPALPHSSAGGSAGSFPNSSSGSGSAGSGSLRLAQTGGFLSSAAPTAASLAGNTSSSSPSATAMATVLPALATATASGGPNTDISPLVASTTASSALASTITPPAVSNHMPGNGGLVSPIFTSPAHLLFSVHPHDSAASLVTRPNQPLSNGSSSTTNKPFRHNQQQQQQHPSPNAAMSSAQFPSAFTSSIGNVNGSLTSQSGSTTQQPLPMLTSMAAQQHMASLHGNNVAFARASLKDTTMPVVPATGNAAAAAVAVAPSTGHTVSPGPLVTTVTATVPQPAVLPSASASSSASCSSSGYLHNNALSTFGSTNSATSFATSDTFLPPAMLVTPPAGGTTKHHNVTAISTLQLPNTSAIGPNGAAAAAVAAAAFSLPPNTLSRSTHSIVNTGLPTRCFSPANSPNTHHRATVSTPSSTTATTTATTAVATATTTTAGASTIVPHSSSFVQPASSPMLSPSQPLFTLPSTLMQRINNISSAAAAIAATADNNVLLASIASVPVTGGGAASGAAGATPAPVLGTASSNAPSGGVSQTSPAPHSTSGDDVDAVTTIHVPTTMAPALSTLPRPCLFTPLHTGGVPQTSAVSNTTVTAAAVANVAGDAGAADSGVSVANIDLKSSLSTNRLTTGSTTVM